MSTVTTFMMVVLAIVVLGAFALLLWKVLDSSINLSRLVSEGGGKASLGRFQFLVFVLVIAGLYLILSLDAGRFVTIPDSVLILLGISGGAFVLAKAVGGGARR